MDKLSIPRIKKSISDFMYEEEGNIPRSKMLTIGSMLVLLSMIFLSDEAFAKHGSHSSHGSHGSHGSHSSSSHVSHGSHSSHVSGDHSSHGSGVHFSHDNSISSIPTINPQGEEMMELLLPPKVQPNILLKTIDLNPVPDTGMDTKEDTHL